MRLSTCLFSLGCLTLLPFFQASASCARTETKHGTVLFAEDFESYKPGAKEIKTFAFSQNAEVVEESFYPSSNHRGERSLRLAEYNRPDHPQTQGFSYLEAVTFPAAKNLEVSFWVKTKDASVKIYLIPADKTEGKSVEIVVFEGGTPPPQSDTDEGWQFIKKKVEFPPGASQLKLAAKIVSRLATGLAYLKIDDIKIEQR